MLNRLRSWFRPPGHDVEDLPFPRPVEHLFRAIDPSDRPPVPIEGLVELEGDIVVTHDTDVELEAWSQAFGEVTIVRKV